MLATIQPEPGSEATEVEHLIVQATGQITNAPGPGTTSRRVKKPRWARPGLQTKLAEEAVSAYGVLTNPWRLPAESVQPPTMTRPGFIPSALVEVAPGKSNDVKTPLLSRKA